MNSSCLRDSNLSLKKYFLKQGAWRLALGAWQSRNICSHNKIGKSIKVTQIMHFIYEFMWFYTQYHVIMSFEILCLTKVLCGIWDIFPWQIIWDLSKKFQLRRNIHSHKKIGKFIKRLEIMHASAILCDFIHNITLFWVLSFGVFSREVHLL